jgi:hypothetical protein
MHRKWEFFKWRLSSLRDSGCSCRRPATAVAANASLSAPTAPRLAGKPAEILNANILRHGHEQEDTNYVHRIESGWPSRSCSDRPCLLFQDRLHHLLQGQRVSKVKRDMDSSPTIVKSILAKSIGFRAHVETVPMVYTLLT